MIDELDKMIDPQRVTQLLRDIKGIFEVERAFTLVSISTEAARFLDLGAIKTRTEFNSSFDTVISIPGVPPHDSRSLLKAHLDGSKSDEFNDTAALAVGVLTAGIPREIVRVGDALLESRACASAAEACTAIMRDELAAFLDQVVASQADVTTLLANGNDTINIQLFRMIPYDFIENPSSIRGLASRALTLWKQDIVNGNHGETEVANGEIRLLEEWRRLLVRLSVAYILMLSPVDMDRSIQLQDIIRIASTSADAGRLKLVSYLIHNASRSDVKYDDISIDDIMAISYLMQIPSQTLTDRELLNRLNGCSRSQVAHLKEWHLVKSQRKGARHLCRVNII